MAEKVELRRLVAGSDKSPITPISRVLLTDSVATDYSTMAVDTYNRQLSVAAATTVQTAALGTLEDIGFLSRLASRTSRFQHPAVRQFLEEDADQSTETTAAAYQSALDELGSRLTAEERKRIGPSCGIRDVLGIVNEARILYSKSSKRRDKVEKMARVLNCYSGAIDAATQHHPEYTSLVWGSMKFILQVSLNYFDILSGLSSMLTEIGDNLGRFDMYLQMYPSTRMKAICSRLYAAIVGFFKDAIIFFKKSRLRKYFSAFWSPFEVKFKGAVEEIKRLERLAENDATAMALMQLQMENADQVRIIIDFRNNEARILLSDLRKELFYGHEIDTTYHEDLVNLYTTTATPDWDYWFKVERKHVSWSHRPRSTLTYMQTDLVEPQIYCKWIALGHSLAGVVPFAHLVWSPSMTAYSALASILIQILQQRPDLLHRESRDFYLQKFRRSTTFEGLWSVFQELLTTLPGLLCYITIASIGDQEATFAKQIIDLFESKHGCPVNLQLVTPIHPVFPKPKGFIDIDAMYDVSPHMDSTNALHHVVLAELGIPSRLAEAIQATLWQSLWRTVCYSINAIALHQLRLAISAAVGGAEGAQSGFLDWLWKRDAEQYLQSYLRPCLEKLVFSIPLDIRERLEKTLKAVIQKHTRMSEGDSSEGAPHYDLPDDMGTRQNRPNHMQCREATWGEMKQILERAPTGTFASFFRSHFQHKVKQYFTVTERFLGTGSLLDDDQSEDYHSEVLPCGDWPTLLESVFSGGRWDATSVEAGNKFRQEIVVAIEKGLMITVHIMLYTDDCNCVL